MHWLAAYDNAVSVNGQPASYYFQPSLNGTNATVWLPTVLACGPGCGAAPLYGLAEPDQQHYCMEHCHNPKNSCSGSQEKQLAVNYGTPQWLGETEFGSKEYTRCSAHVAVVPCQVGDQYMGDTMMQGSYHMRGKVVFESIVKDLVKTQGLGSNGRENLLVVHGRAPAAVAQASATSLWQSGFRAPA